MLVAPLHWSNSILHVLFKETSTDKSVHLLTCEAKEGSDGQVCRGGQLGEEQWLDGRRDKPVAPM